jgi:hypothetical protein
MSREAIDALEEWHKTTRALRKAPPDSSEWVRLRMIAQEQRVRYESLVDEGASSTQDNARLEAPSTSLADRLQTRFTHSVRVNLG